MRKNHFSASQPSGVPFYIFPLLNPSTPEARGKCQNTCNTKRIGPIEVEAQCYLLCKEEEHPCTFHQEDIMVWA